jgi:hypothetical protein
VTGDTLSVGPWKSYPCLAELDAGDGERRVCGQPATYQAKGNEARWGHVCGDCHEALPEGERELYAFVGLGVEAYVAQLFTFYCEVHRDHVVLGPSPNSVPPGRPLAPTCPHCYRTMFWVPNGGTAVPAAEEATS